MEYTITAETASPITLAAVRARVPVNGIASAWKPALDKVWAHLRTNSVPNIGTNVFLYHHPNNPGDPMDIDFGVQVLHPFAGEGEIRGVITPTGEVAQAIHIGPYSDLRKAHSALHQWCQANGREIAHASWEIYGHWNNDPAKLETTIRYLLL